MSFNFKKIAYVLDNFIKDSHIPYLAAMLFASGTISPGCTSCSSNCL